MFDPFDPFGLNARLPQRQPERAEIKPLAPQEEDTMLGKIAGAGLGGLGYVGSVLEKTFGGRAIRGALGGKGREMLSIIPFSDTLGITDPEERVSGRELLRDWGMADNEDNWGNFLGGMGLELATDPGMYLSFGSGALTNAGRVARKIGAVPNTARARVTETLGNVLKQNPTMQAAAETAAGGSAKLAGMLDEPLGGLVGVGLPFRAPAAVFGQGQAGVNTLDNLGKGFGFLDSTLRKIPLAGSMYGHTLDAARKGLDAAGLYARAYFNPDVMGATTHLGQEVAQDASKAIRPMTADYVNRALMYGEQLKGAGDDAGDVLRQVLEGVHPDPSTVNPVIRDVAKKMTGDYEGMLARLQAKGVDMSYLDDLEAGYGARYHTPLQKPGLGRNSPGQPLATRDPRMAGRMPVLKDIVGGTEGINKLVLDPMVHQGTPLQAAAHIRANYLSQGLGQAEAYKQAERLVNWARGLDPSYQASIGTASPLRFFGNHPLADFETYFRRAARLDAAGDAVQNILARQALAPGSVLPRGVSSYDDALQAVGLTGPAAQDAARAALGQSSLSGYYIPEEAIKEATRYLTPFKSPEYTRPLGGMFDTLTNWTKAFQTAIWPAFHVRNLASGAWQNLTKGITESPGGMLNQVQDAYSLMKTGKFTGEHMIPELAGMGSEEAAKQIAREMYSWGVGGHMPHISRELVGPTGDLINVGPTLTDYLARVPGQTSKSVGAALGELGTGASQAWNPLNVAGVGTTTDLFAPVRAGRHMGDVVEGTNRGALYLGLRRQGFTAEQAAKHVLDAHFDYTPMGRTAFERQVMSRIIPYYCVPDDCEILTRRGWLKVDELTIGEDVLTMDHETGVSVWAPCEDKAIFNYEGELLRIGGKRGYFDFTPNHRWPVIQKSNPKGGATNHRVIVQGYELRSNHSIPRTSEFRETRTVATPREAAIVGWIVTDGTQRVRDRSPGYQELVIYQSPGKYLDEIIALLGADGSVRKPNPATGVVPVGVIGPMNKRISELLPCKSKIVEFVCNLNNESAAACYDAMLKAEASFSGPKRQTYHFAQNDGEVLDAFQILAQMMGKVANKSQRGAYVSIGDSRLKMPPTGLMTTWYKGRVWCPQTKHGTWLMRRNGRIVWTGNTFTKGNIPYVVKDIAQRPSGLSALLPRVAEDLRQEAGFLPAYLGSGLAVPLSEEDETGNKRYLTRLDLNPEQAFEMIKGGPNWARDTMMGILGQTNPIIKAPLEYATGKQFFTGRDLGDLYTMTGSVALDELLANTPISRGLTTARTLMDERKWNSPGAAMAIPLNLATGARVTDVDMPKYRTVAEREYVKDVLQGLPEIGKFESLYLKPGMEQFVTPAEMALLRLNKTVQERARGEAAKRREVGAR